MEILSPDADSHVLWDKLWFDWLGKDLNLKIQNELRIVEKFEMQFYSTWTIKNEWIYV